MFVQNQKSFGFPSADEWIRKQWYIYTMENYSAIKKNTFESGSEEAVPGPSVFPSREPGLSGDFWGSQEEIGRASCRERV